MTKYVSVIICFIAIITLSACTANNVELKEALNSELSLSQQAAQLKTSAACEAQKGNWRKMGMLQREACVLPAIDAGKACNDNKQCQVACITLQDISAGKKSLVNVMTLPISLVVVPT